MRNEFYVTSDQVLIKLSRGHWTIIDRDDFDLVYSLDLLWFPLLSHNTIYARASRSLKEYYLLHRVIMKLSRTDALIPDHKNRNGLDNRKQNLRLVDDSISNFNRSINKNNSSGIKGVSYNKQSDKWEAYICVNSKKVSLGRFNKIENAIEARSKAEDAFIL